MANVYLGDYPRNATVRIGFDTFALATGASITMTGFAVGDIKIYKVSASATTLRTGTSGYTLIDTDGTDIGATPITGIHGATVDLSDNTDAGFFSVGGEYRVVISTVTVDSATVSFTEGWFSIERYSAAVAMLRGNVTPLIYNFTITRGSTSQMRMFNIVKTDGAAFTGLAFNSPSISCYYYRQNAATSTAVTLATMTLGTWASGGFKEVDATNMAGVYELCLPDLALSIGTGVDSAMVYLAGATVGDWTMRPVVLNIDLVTGLPVGTDSKVLLSTDAQDLESTLSVSANVKKVNTVTITGNGSSTPFNV